MSFWNILLAILVFSVIIIVHEFGHFIVAKYNKVEVNEFSLGMGPRLISWGKTEKGYRVVFFKTTKYLEEHPMFGRNTLYSWKLLPFGGSCAMLGEDEEVEDENAFGKKSVYARMAIVFAGPFFNFILAFVLSLIIVGVAGYEVCRVSFVEEGSPAEAAGLEAGDKIVGVNGEKIVIDSDLRLYQVVHPFTDAPVTLDVERGGEEKEFVITPRLVERDGGSAYLCGFSHASPRESAGFFGSIKYAAYDVKYYIKMTVQSLGMIFRGKVSKDDVAGPVGIVKLISDEVDDANEHGGAGIVALSLMSFAVLLSANLGVMNLIPIPALDGGRLLFLIIEWIRKKPLPQRFEGYVNMAGFMLLMGLMVFIMFNDITKFFR